jgi:hypothetical protein
MIKKTFSRKFTYIIMRKLNFLCFLQLLQVPF